ncbi:hypothetical protein ACSBR2_017772 [Camellia fascicularis]
MIFKPSQKVLYLKLPFLAVQCLLLLQCDHGLCKDCLSRMFSASLDTTLLCRRCHHVSVVGNSVQALHKNYAIIATIHSFLNSSSGFDCDFTNEGKENNDDLDDDDDESSSRNGSSIELASHLLTAGSADWEGVADRVLSGGQGQ